MGIKTNIGYCDSSLNLMMGCNGCELWRDGLKTCYAGLLTDRYSGKPGWPNSFEEPKIFPHRLIPALRWKDLRGQPRPDKPWLNGYPRIIFLNDMGDTFTEDLHIQWLDPYIEKMENSPHIFLLLTKRPRKMYEYFAYLGHVPTNFWLGTSVTSMENYGRISWLTKIRAPVKWLSLEPLLGPIDLLSINSVMDGDTPNIDWVVGGGESGIDSRDMNPLWIRGIKNQCEEVGIKFFFKQWGGLRPKSGGNTLDNQQYYGMPLWV